MREGETYPHDAFDPGEAALGEGGVVSAVEGVGALHDGLEGGTELALDGKGDAGEGGRAVVDVLTREDEVARVSFRGGRVVDAGENGLGCHGWADREGVDGSGGEGRRVHLRGV